MPFDELREKSSEKNFVAVEWIEFTTNSRVIYFQQDYYLQFYLYIECVEIIRYAYSNIVTCFLTTQVNGFLWNSFQSEESVR